MIVISVVSINSIMNSIIIIINIIYMNIYIYTHMRERDIGNIYIYIYICICIHTLYVIQSSLIRIVNDKIQLLNDNHKY